MTFGEGVREGHAWFEVNALKGPGLLSAVVWEPTLPSWLVVCRLASPDLGRTGALVGTVPKRPPMEMISRVTHDLRRRCARSARMVRGQCVKGPRVFVGSRLGTDPTVRVGRLPFGFAAVRLIPAHNAKEKGPHIAAQAYDLSPTMVGTAGFEPTTLCPPGRCATRLRYAPMLLVLSPPCSGPTSITGLIEKGFSGAAAAALLPAPSGSA